MDQFKSCRLVYRVSVGPVDANLEGFLDGGGQWKGKEEGSQSGWEVENEIEIKSLFLTKFTIKIDCIWLHFGNSHMLGSTVDSLSTTQHNVPDSVHIPCTAFQIILELRNIHLPLLLALLEHNFSVPQMLEWHTDCSSGCAAPQHNKTCRSNTSLLP